MKKHLLCIMSLFAVLQSCTTDQQQDVSATTSPAAWYSKPDHSPDNPNNPYDIAGRIHNDLADVYDSGNNVFTNITDVSDKIRAIAGLNADIQAMALTTDLQQRYASVINTVNNTQQDGLDDALSVSTLTQPARQSFSGFMDSLSLFENSEYGDIYDFVAGYESAVLSNTSFTAKDKTIILTATSVARYTLDRRRRKDRDWNSSVTGITGTVNGGENNLRTAVEMSLVIEMSMEGGLTQ